MNSYEELKNQKEAADKLLLTLEYVLSYVSIAAFFALLFVVSYFEMADYLRIILIVIGALIMAIGIAYAIKIEQVAGYYECGNCHHRYIPSYQSVFWSMHIGRTRLLKCPNCEKKSWSKKVLTK